MRAYEIQAFGLEHLKLIERPDPVPGPREVLVRLHAASLNYRDYLTVLGRYNPRLRLPIIPLSDGAGEVVAVGPDVRAWRVGDRVAGNFAQEWLAGEAAVESLRMALGGPLDGTLAELRVFPEYGLLRIPDYMSYEAAATLPCAGLTAWSALTQAGTKAGDTLVVLGTGGVSLFGLQLAKAGGARVIVTSSSDEKLERARALGADHTINYKTKANWAREVRRLTEMRGADHVLEVGGAGTLEQSIAATRAFGHISLIGVLAGGSSELNLVPVLMQNIRIQGVVVGSRDQFADMLRALELHRIEPVIDRVFAFSEARAALEHLESQRHFGKICIRIHGS